jgi:predicted exporter
LSEQDRRVIPNFAAMNEAEILGVQLAGGDFAEAAKHVYECRAVMAHLLAAEWIVRDLAAATTEQQIAVIRAVAKQYVDEASERMRGKLTAATAALYPAERA